MSQPRRPKTGMPPNGPHHRARSGLFGGVLRRAANAILARIRPGKSIDDSIGDLDLVHDLLEWAVSLWRGLCLSLRCGRLTPIFVGARVRVRFASKISIGRYATIGDGAILSGLGTHGVVIGERASIGAYARLVAGTDIQRPGHGIVIGPNVGVGEFASIGGSGGVSIGENTIIGQYFSAHPENHNYDDLSRPIRHQGTTRKPIHIGADCWFGAKVTVVAGVTIGPGCVIGAGSVVTRDVPARSIVAGVPARILGVRGKTDHA